MRVLRQGQAILLLPSSVTVIIPGLLVYLTKTVNIGWSLPFPVNLAASILGLVLAGVGLTLMVKTITLFATIGEGTLAPWSPTQKLVVRGVYRYMRNPMISGVFCILFAESILLGSIVLFYWLLFFVFLNVTYIPLLEEPSLERRFGEDYRLYKQHVPRWIPRLSPWHAPFDYLR